MTRRKALMMVLGAAVLLISGVFAPIEGGIPSLLNGTCRVSTDATTTTIDLDKSKQADNNAKMRVILSEASLATRHSIVTALTPQPPSRPFAALADINGSEPQRFKVLVEKSWVAPLTSYFRRDGNCQASLVFTDDGSEWVITLQLDRLMADPKRWLLPE